MNSNPTLWRILAGVILTYVIQLAIAAKTELQVTESPNASVRAETETVIFGPELEQTIQLPKPDVRDALDIAYDTESRSILLLSTASSGGKGHFVRQYDLSGSKMREWILPVPLSPLTVLFSKAGSLQLIMAEWDGQLGSGHAPIAENFARVSLLIDSSLPQTAYLRTAWLQKHDTALNPRVARMVREQMKEVNYISPMPDVAIPRSQPDSVFINARPLGNDLVEWSDDMSTIAFGWDSFKNLTLCMRDAAGDYGHFNIERLVEDAAAKAGVATGTRLGRAILLQRDMALFGITETVGQKKRFSTVYLSTVGEAPSVVRTSIGRLARSLKHH